MNIEYYYCTGAVRGECGVKHKSVRAAEACIARDQAGCASQGGYSDRGIMCSGDHGSLPLAYYEEFGDLAPDA